MKRLTALLSLFVLLTAFTCENEPLEGEFGLTCESAEFSSESAEQAFMDATEANYSELCNAYKLALLSEIETCGDNDGSLQAKIDILGDCTFIVPPDDCETATQAADQAQASFDSATDDNYTILCNTLKSALETKIEFCGDADGEIQTEIDTLGDCINDSNSQPDHHAFMTANLDGEQFNDLKPNGYNVLNRAIGVVSGFNGNDETYIRIQGNSTYALINPNTTTKEITLFIPESNWVVGAYDLILDSYSTYNGDTPNPHYGLVYYNNDDYIFAIENEGSITITEFNLAERVIKGTFEFTFLRENSADEQLGPFECINGTFDYSLDHEYFD